ncbi:MAG: hypothetical protein IKM02_01915 [Clostridia bacterium]|nr:hypothetical protein [Clostridia bacterium]
MAVNIFLTAASGVLVIGMDSIVYTCSGEDACIIQLDFENRQVRYMKYTSEYDNRWMTGQLSDFMAVRFKFLAALSKAPFWFERYSDGDGSTDEAWGIDMRFGNRVKTSQGAGDYPGGWKILISQIMSLARSFPEELLEQNRVPGNVGTADI